MRRRRRGWPLPFVDRLLCAQEDLFGVVLAREGQLEPGDVLAVADRWTTEARSREGFAPDGDWSVLVSALDDWANE